MKKLFTISILINIVFISLFVWITFEPSSKDFSTPNTVIEEVKEDLIIGCGFDEMIYLNPENWYNLSNKELSQIELLSDFTGLPSNYMIYGAPIQNAAAVILNNERMILLDKELLDNLDAGSNSYWTSMSILAHEIGHHLAGHTLSSEGNVHKSELEADKYSGYVLYRMGASLEEATVAITTLVGLEDSDTHPGREKRIEAIKKGWTEANEQRYKSAIPPTPDDSYADSESIYKEYLPKNLVTKETYEGFLRGEVSWGILNDYEGIILEKKEESHKTTYCKK